MSRPTRYDVIEFQKRAQDFAEDAMQTLVELCVGGVSEGARIRSAVEILDRAYGKPTPMVVSSSMDDEAEDEVADRAERFTRSISSLASRSRKGS